MEINNWTLHGGTTDSGVFTAPSVKKYEFQNDFYEWTRIARTRRQQRGNTPYR